MSRFLSLVKMATARRQSNVERGKWRAQCREVLCQHIETKLGISLDPSQVRLQPTRDDAYAWQVLPEKQHLFAKNLSDHSIRSYKELCDGVGVTFEAVRTTSAPSVAFPGQGCFDVSDPEAVSFTSRINELQVQSDYLSQQLQVIRCQLDSEVKLRLSVEEKFDLCRNKLEATRDDLEKATRRENYFRNTASKYSRGMSKMIPIIKELQDGAAMTEEGFL